MGTETGEAQNKNRKMELNIGCRFQRDVNNSRAFTHHFKPFNTMLL